MKSMSLDPTNRIHQTAWIEDGAVLGKNNYIGPYVYIGSNVRIGDLNTFTGHCSIGMNAEHRDFFKKEGEIIIGHGNMVREFTTINSSTTGVTRMGNACVMLRGSHLSHDSVLEDHVNVSCNVLIGGESVIMRWANLGLGSIIHQRQVIGSHCMIGMGAIIVKTATVLPGYTWVGNPARPIKLNQVGLDRAKVDSVMLNEETQRYWKLLGRTQ